MRNIDEEIRLLLIKLGFNEIKACPESIYEYGNAYYKITYVKGLNGYVIEYAESKHEAENNLYEDGDIYPLSLGEKLLPTLDADF